MDTRFSLKIPAARVLNRRDALTLKGMDMVEVAIRPAAEEDFDDWLPLWDAYNAFYGREGETALPRTVTDATWSRFLDPDEPMNALVAVVGGQMLGLAHYLYHRSTTSMGLFCYLQDLFTSPEARRSGIATTLIHRVYDEARKAGSPRVYWQTHESNAEGRRLYDKLAERSGFIVYRKQL